MVLQHVNVTASKPSMWSCRHQYHLQCIMQWAQRSRECPMCFRALQLQVCSSSAFQVVAERSFAPCWPFGSPGKACIKKLTYACTTAFSPCRQPSLCYWPMLASCSHVHGVLLHFVQSTTIVNFVGVSPSLQDPMMQELLPFGEYIPPEHSQPAQHMYMGLEAWELERILARLAVTNGAPVLSTGRRRGHSRAEAVIVPGCTQ